MKNQGLTLNISPNLNVPIEVSTEEALFFPFDCEPFSHFFIQKKERILITHLKNGDGSVIHSTGKKVGIVFFVPCLIDFELVVEPEDVFHFGRDR